MATGVIPGETRKVGTIEGEALWVAPTSEGGFCTLLGGGGGCDRTGTVPLDITLSAAVVPPGKSPGRTPPNEIATAIPANLLLQPCYAPLPLADPDRCG